MVRIIKKSSLKEMSFLTMNVVNAVSGVIKVACFQHGGAEKLGPNVDLLAQALAQAVKGGISVGLKAVDAEGHPVGDKLLAEIKNQI